MTDSLGSSRLGLDPDLRRELGLGEHESIRVIHAAGHLITLERCGSDDATAVPWDRDLVLTAEVRAFPLADLLSMIHGSGKSGFLLFSHRDHEKSVYLHRGEVVFAASNQRADRLGECLLRSRDITLAQLHEADRRWTPNTRFGRVLVEIGVLTPRDLWNAVKLQVEDIVRSLFGYTAGTVHFWEGEVQPDNIVRLALPTRRLIAEGLKRRDELFKFLAVLEDPRTVLRAGGGADRSRLSSSERLLLEAVGEEGSFPTVCRRAGVDPLSGARALQLLQLVGAVGVGRSEAGADFVGEGDLRSHVEDQLRECVYDHMKLIAELAAPLVAVDGSSAVRERLVRVVEEAAGRRRAIFGGLELGPGGMPDPEEILRRALRLAGDRLRSVGEALGELVAYLEFELNNHPRIEAPESFLEAVEELRARIER